MPPTVQTGSREDRDHRGSRGTGDKRSELVARVRYNNTLPDIPFDPKFIVYPFETNRYVQYNPTSLERAYKHELLTEHDLGVTIDLINPDTYKIDPNSYLDPEDERLLEEDVGAPQDSKRSMRHRTNVSWLRKTEYISTEYNRFTQSADKAESKVGFSIKKKLKEEDMYKDRESQIKAIEATFETNKQPIIKHYSKPGVTPLNVFPVLPDFEMWKHPYAQVIFDSDPAPGEKGKTPQAIEQMSQAMIRGMEDEAGEQFVAYFLPSDETMEKRKRDFEEDIDYTEDDEYEYVLAREYNWSVKNKASKGYEETYFFVMRDDGVYYNELETRVRLSKRRKLGSTAPVNKSRLFVKHRILNDIELAAQDARLSMLEPAQEEEEEMEVEVEEEEAQKSGEESDIERRSEAGSARSRSRSLSRSRSRSRSISRSRSRSVSRSRSRSRSRSVSRSRSRSRSISRSRSRSWSGSRSRSASPSGSGSGSGSDIGSDDEEDKKKKDEEEIFGSDSD